METCELGVVDHHGLAALCRLMYTQHGSPLATREDGGGPAFEYRVRASALWDRLKEWQQRGRAQGRPYGALGGRPLTVSGVV